MTSPNRSDLIKIKRFKESKEEFDRKVQLTTWFYLLATAFLIGALAASDASQVARAAMLLAGAACLAPTLKPRAAGKIVFFVEQNHDAWMRQNKIAGYSRKVGAFLLKDENPEQAAQFHDPNCDECWDEGEALFNLDEHRMLQQQADESVARVPRQSASQLDLLDYYWGVISLNTALKLYVTLGTANLARTLDQSRF
jgi:hypothetical protein